MSHITEILVGIRNLNIVSRIAKKHGYTLTEKKCTIQGSGNNNVDAYLNIKGSQGTAIGFKKEGSEYIMKADMYGVSTTDRKFVDSLKQEYTVEAAKQKVIESGQNIVSTSTDSKGNIYIKISK